MTDRAAVEFEALEYGESDDFRPVRLRFAGDEHEGWSIERNGAAHLDLGPGYRLLETDACGVCSTDLDRRFLPFPLPQVTGHELLARDPDGRRFVVEINASHAARGVAAGCAFCENGLETHCPERLVLGIHDLPGGFGPFVLAPVNALVPVPDAVPDAVAALVEPFAAVLNAAGRIDFAAGDHVAVLGPRRLGLLLVAAIAAEARRRGVEIEIVALSRHEALLDRARRFGATRCVLVRGDGADLAGPVADVVADTTGNPEALTLAARLARREVHLKSTHGQPSDGLLHTTEMVVDELALERLPASLEEAGTRPFFRDAPGAKPRIAWLAAAAPPPWLESAAEVFRATRPDHAAKHFEAHPAPLPRADAAVVDRVAAIDGAVRPREADERSLVRPRGAVLLTPDATTAGCAIATACVARGLRLSTSRCGRFRDALALLDSDEALRAAVGELVTHRFTAVDLADAFATARSPECIKALVWHREAAP